MTLRIDLLDRVLSAEYNHCMTSKRKNPAAVALGRRGAKVRMKKLTPEQRSEIARRAVQARWAKVKGQE